MNGRGDLPNRVRQGGGRVTEQLQVVLRTLEATTAHPTAAELHELVREHLPGISQGTVYRNLARLRDLGCVLELDYGPHAARYDACTEPHYHVRCLQCGRVADVTCHTGKLPEVCDCCGYTILGMRTEFVGICPDCQSQLNGVNNREDVEDGTEG